MDSNLNLLAQTTFPDYWKNGTFENLQCLYYGVGNGSNFQHVWENQMYGYEVELLSHVCVNGSFSHLSQKEWNKRCFPNHIENLVLSRITGLWSLFNFLAGSISNLLTLVAIPYAYYKRRHDFHNSFWTTDIWILHLALCELMYCIFFHPHFFVPSLGYRYLPGIGSWFCMISFTMTILTYTNDWLLVATVAMTRAIALKKPMEWKNFCENKVYVFLVMLSTWMFQVLLMLPIFLQPSIGIGYNCLLGKCNYIPTGQDSLNVLANYVGQPVFIGIPFLTAFLTPVFITTISYLVIWLHIRKIKKGVAEVKAPEDSKIGVPRLTNMEMRFIRTVFYICLCYFLCAIPGILFIDILDMKDPITFLVALSFVWIQFTLNIFIYAYRSEKYRNAYRDVLALMLPCISTLKQKTSELLLLTSKPRTSDKSRQESTTN